MGPAVKGMVDRTCPGGRLAVRESARAGERVGRHALAVDLVLGEALAQLLLELARDSPGRAFVLAHDRHGVAAAGASQGVDEPGAALREPVLQLGAGGR